MTTDELLRKLTGFKVSNWFGAKRKRVEGWDKYKSIKDAIEIAWTIGCNNEGRSAEETHLL
jgi:hypothetical protein